MRSWSAALLFRRISDKIRSWFSNRNIARTARAVARRARPDLQSAPVIFFNASARLGYLSQNAGFSLLAAWGLRLAGVRIVHFVCHSGMSRCVLGTNPDNASQPPPCAACIAQSQRLYADADVRWFRYREDEGLTAKLVDLGIADLEKFSYAGWPLGELVLPGLRWALRRHHLVDDEATRFLCRQYILSAYSLGREFDQLLDELKPQAAVLFNGIMYPEAMARWLAKKRGIRAITHEVGLLPFTAFFTEGQATAYPMDIPADFQLTAEQDRQLDEYLSQRLQGKFSMAGIQFWPHMQQLSESLQAKAAQFKKVVPIFTNVIFDTSQVHANSLFPHMFAWLDEILGLIKMRPDTLFVIRAHPDEMRPGTRKQSRENVRQWVQANGVAKLANVVFVDSGEYLSSYTLIQRAHFVMVYNSSIGLEASIMGKPVLCAGAARYTQFPTVFYPESARDYLAQVETFLAAPKVEHPASFAAEARRVLYFQLFRTALPFGEFLASHSRMGYVHLKPFPSEALLRENSPAIRVIYAGVVNDKPFLV
ncbi:MAG: hypothetical protein WD751_02585 [Anaerolineales bacterium]